ncbi:tuberoinfundibular peptide of 39 residues [Gadus morhua]|uniref:Tuberoinfundibular peptide of 39 residues n=2 Tax=Gadus TaxID=8048 RepID=A0A8C5BNR2_GADMO|nr:tuberoinfundibular peptide of 39 residues [Gadus morhua]
MMNPLVLGALRMSQLPMFSRSSLLLLCILATTLLTSGYPRPLLQLSSPDNSDEVTEDDYDVHLPYFSLHNWGIELTSAPGLMAAANSKPRLIGRVWLSGPKSQLSEGEESRMDKGWPAEWSRGSVGKRNMVVADDAAFREKSKLLTAMERQKWLNSYMQKLLVVNTK